MLSNNYFQIPNYVLIAPHCSSCKYSDLVICNDHTLISNLTEKPFLKIKTKMTPKNVKKETAERYQGKKALLIIFKERILSFL